MLRTRCCPAEAMRIRSLTLLSFLLLAAQALSARVLNEAKNRQDSALVGDPPTPLRRFRPETLTSGKFSTTDQASCNLTAIIEEPVTMLKVECTQMDQEFSCVFTGNPTECLKHKNKKTYWKQIILSLWKQKNLCRNFIVLKASVCRNRFPGSNLKLVNSTLIGSVEPKEMETSSSPGRHIRDTLSQESTNIKEDIPSSLAEAQDYPFKIPDCPDNPHVKNVLDRVMEFCSPFWTMDFFWCTFYTKELKKISCY